MDQANYLLALRCSKASLLLRSLRPRQPPRPRRNSTCMECELRAARLGAELAAERRVYVGHARFAGAEVLMVLVLVLLLLLGLGLYSAAE